MTSVEYYEKLYQYFRTREEFSHLYFFIDDLLSYIYSHSPQDAEEFVRQFVNSLEED